MTNKIGLFEAIQNFRRDYEEAGMALRDSKVTWADVLQSAQALVIEHDALKAELTRVTKLYHDMEAENSELHENNSMLIDARDSLEEQLGDTVDTWWE